MTLAEPYGPVSPVGANYDKYLLRGAPASMQASAISLPRLFFICEQSVLAIGIPGTNVYRNLFR